MFEIQSYDQIESMFSAFKQKSHEREGLSHLVAVFSMLHRIDGADIDDDIQNLVLDYCLYTVRESARILASRSGDREHWYKVLKVFTACEKLPGPKMVSCVIKVRELLKDFDSQEDIAALRWLHEGEGLDDVHLYRISGGLTKRQREDAISYHRDHRLVDIEALAKLKDISFGSAQHALQQYPPIEQEKILKNAKCREISRKLRKAIRRKILS